MNSKYNNLLVLPPHLIKLAKEQHLFKSHPYQLVLPSELPNLIAMTLGLVLFFSVPVFFEGKPLTLLGYTVFSISVLFFFFLIFAWAWDVTFESKHLYVYTRAVQKNILLGMSLFIISEVMLFFAFFWAFFSNSLTPTIAIDNVWPPIHVVVLNPWLWPFLNTLILLTSGVTVNWFYFEIQSFNFNISKLNFVNHDKYKSLLFNSNNKSLSDLINVDLLNSLSNSSLTSKKVQTFFLKPFFYFFNFEELGQIKKGHFVMDHFDFMTRIYLKYVNSKIQLLLSGLFYTIALGAFFLYLQVQEYEHHAQFSIDNIYGTVFYTTTGLHGLHVFLGVCLLFLVYIRFLGGQFIPNTRPLLSVTTAVWYWHFVDVVWLFLFVFVYVVFS